MEYIKKEDYLGLIKEAYLNQIIAGNPSLLDDVEAMAMDEVKIYMPHINFTTNTNKALKMRVMDIALYHIHSRLPVKDIPQTRIDRYLQALQWLEKTTKRNITLEDDNNPQSTDNPIGYLKYGGNPKQNFYF